MEIPFFTQFFPISHNRPPNRRFYGNKSENDNNRENDIKSNDIPLRRSLRLIEKKRMQTYIDSGEEEKSIYKNIEESDIDLQRRKLSLLKEKEIIDWETISNRNFLAVQQKYDTFLNIIYN